MKTRRIFSRCWWSNYFYWIPTMMTEYHPKDESVLTNFYVKSEEQSYTGSQFDISVMFLGFTWNISFWWNIEEKHY